MKPIYMTALHLLHGGVEKAIASLANSLCSRGYPVTILCSYYLGEPVYALDPRVSIQYLTPYQPNREAFHQAVSAKRVDRILTEGAHAVRILWAKHRTMVQAIRSIRSGIIISSRHEHHLILAKHGHPGVFRIAQLHHDVLPDSKLYHSIIKGYHGLDVLTTLTDELTDELAAGFAAQKGKATQPEPRCVTMPNYLPDAFFGDRFLASKEASASRQPPPDPPKPASAVQSPTEPPELASSRQESPRENVVLAVGRLEREKGFDRLIDVWARVVDKAPDWRLRILGDGRERANIEEQIRVAGLGEHVSLPGMTPYEDVLRAMSSASLYALPSRSEGFDC